MWSSFTVTDGYQVPIPREQKKWADWVRENKLYFKDKPGIVFLKAGDVGYHVASLCFAIFNEQAKFSRKIEVVIANDDQGAELVRMDRACSMRLVGSPHIAEIRTLGNTELHNRATTQPRIYIALEYFPNGSLRTLRERTARTGRRIPSEVLWNVFRCLISAVIEIGYADRHGIDDEVFFSITLNSSSPRNLVFGDFRWDGEHETIPVAKLRDFSSARQESTPDDADFFNLHSIGQFMVELACNTTPREELVSVEREYTTENIVPTLYYPGEVPRATTFRTRVNPHLTDDPVIDQALKDLVAYCMHTTGTPPTERLLKWITTVIDNRLWEELETKRGAHTETPAEISEFLSTYIMSAEDEPPAPPRGLKPKEDTEDTETPEAIEQRINDMYGLSQYGFYN